ncbi:uncharacterized protein LOC126550988 [Aphis gossypii]|uniref:uncharacterized protein LOC126550988 n=1 Tax=Aphis gossypii TaxID=80765 RepID=UPI002159981B|nr:uncharacterized protein LOC126550988 [Aphis gossypii]
MPNINGPGQWKRRLLGSVVESQLLYAAPVWAASVCGTAKSIRNLRRPQRVAALRAIRAYRTVSDEAAFVLSNMPPVDLIAREKVRIKSRYNDEPNPGDPPVSRDRIKREERKATIVEWQMRWSISGKAAWTRRLIPDLVRWYNRTTPVVPWTYHMTQALTGHGCFQFYLHRFARAASPRCVHCQCPSDTAEHTLFHCDNWNGLRTDLRERLGHPPTSADVPDILCGPLFEDLPTDGYQRTIALCDAEETLRLFYKMVENILSVKEEEERARQAVEADR